MMYTDRNSGERYTQAEIDRNYSKARAEVLQGQLDEHGFNFCVKCKEENLKVNRLEYLILDCSHIKSRQKCKNDGDIELIWDKENLQILCRHHHTIFDKLNLQK